MASQLPIKDDYGILCLNTVPGPDPAQRTDTRLHEWGHPSPIVAQLILRLCLASWRSPTSCAVFRHCSPSHCVRNKLFEYRPIQLSQRVIHGCQFMFLLCCIIVFSEPVNQSIILRCGLVHEIAALISPS